MDLWNAVQADMKVADAEAAKGPDGLTDHRDPDSANEPVEGETDDEAAPKDEGENQGTEQETDEAKEAFIEIPADEDGGEPTKIPIADAVEAVKQLKALEGKVEAIVSQAETVTEQRRVAAWKQQDEAMGKTLATLKVIGEGLKAMAPQMPPQALLNPNHQDYDPDLYHLRRAQYEQVVGAFNQIAQQHQQVEAERQKQADENRQQLARAEVEKLFRRSSEWQTNFETMRTETQALMRDHYGIGEDVLAGLAHHGFYLAAADLVKYHKLLAGSKDTKAKVEARAPKIVKPTRQPPTHQERGPGGQYVTKASKALESGPYSQSKGADFFEAALKSGAIR